MRKGEKKLTETQKQGAVKRARIQHIVELMARGLYVNPETPKRLAAEWGMKPKSVENYASAASTILRLSLGDDMQLRNEMLATMKRIAAISFAKAQELYPAMLPDGSPHPHAGESKERNAYNWFNTAIQALDRLGNVIGLNAPKRVEIKNEHTLEELSALQATAEANKCAMQEARKARELDAQAARQRAAPADVQSSSLPPLLTSLLSSDSSTSCLKTGGDASSS